MKKALKVLLAFDSPYFKPMGYDYAQEFADRENWYTEADVYQALLENGYEVRLLGLFNDISILFEEVKQSPPDVIFNLTEVFNQRSFLEKNVAAVLEMLEIPYTGASAASLFMCNDKALSKKILSFHRIKVPHFYTFERGRRVWLPKKLKLPAIIKPLTEEASRGISQASVVDNEEAFVERIKFIHEKIESDAIAEEYIDGRELYISAIGAARVRVFPAREFKFGQLPEDEPRIATYKAKWDTKYQDRWGIKSVFAGKLPNGMDARIEETCKRAYRALNIQSYARFDIRVTPDGAVYILEANANPCIASIDEVAQSAEKVGISYGDLIKKIIALAFERKG